ncbi:hypothetical protein [Christiangramia crocea]|uniref:BIG2 domain-containing protein n=1 Tax=Christiangramia crocea TaxID=2904124 RepID=A0A9X2A7X2_9FLAO|nr:hypothetical protein [Gramella crocea]MCG9971942.1 hypothetical protein [Gramella crocea]
MFRSLKVLLVVILLFNLSCSKDSPEDNTPTDPTENPGSSENPNIDYDLVEITGTVDLGENLKGEELKVVGVADDYEVAENGDYIAGVTSMDKKVLFVENNNGDMLYASFVEDENQAINAETTAKVIFGMMPWTANTSFSDLSKILDEVKEKEQFIALVEAIEVAAKNNQSPLTDETVLSSFKSLLSSSSANEQQSMMRVQEVDYLVEPKINYENSNLLVNNDGTTTAAWGLEVLDYEDNTSLTGNLMLVGNQVSFPSIESVWDYFWNDGSATSMVFKKAEDLEIPLGYEGKYRMKFGGPMRGSSSLSIDAAFYNFYTSINDIFTAFGVKSDQYAPSIESCDGNIFGGLIDIYINALQEDELTVKFFLFELYEFSKSSLLELSRCSEYFSGMSDAVTSNKEKYLGHALRFLDAYSKVEISYKLGKKFGDMALLNNIDICRQVLDGEIYPCFKLVENPDIDDTVLAKDEQFKIDVSTELNITPEEETYPVGAKIHWEVIEGDGTLDSEITNVSSDGMAEVTFVAGEEEKQVIHASVRGEGGEVIDEVEYNLKVSEEVFDYEGTWLYQYSCWDGECRTEIKFIMDASGKSVSSEYRNRNPNDFSWNEWVDYHITYYLLYNSSNKTLRLTNNYYTSNVSYFQVDSVEQTEFIIRSEDPESTSYIRLVRL